jgi:LAO/AO transport system kinase
MPDDLRARFRRGDRLALSRLLSLAAHGDDLGPLLAELGPSRQPARVVAVTGSGGVGKSTLVGRLIEKLRSQNQSVAVLACDPQSPLSGGALLGDRFRMPSRPDDPGVFIRSLATPSGQQSVAAHLDVMVRLLEAFGFDVVLIETVGAGQGDTVVRGLADVVVLLLQPEAGDDLQWEKAGVLEVADVVVVHKGDLPGAEAVEAQVRMLLNLPGCREVPVLRVSSKSEQGLDDLVKLLQTLPGRRSAVGASDLLRLVQEQLAERFWDRADLWHPILERWRRRELGDVQAADEVLSLLGRSASAAGARRSLPDS